MCFYYYYFHYSNYTIRDIKRIVTYIRLIVTHINLQVKNIRIIIIPGHYFKGVLYHIIWFVLLWWRQWKNVAETAALHRRRIGRPLCDHKGLRESSGAWLKLLINRYCGGNLNAHFKWHYFGNPIHFRIINGLLTRDFVEQRVLHSLGIGVSRV